MASKPLNILIQKDPVLYLISCDSFFVAERFWRVQGLYKQLQVIARDFAQVQKQYIFRWHCTEGQ